MDFWLAVPALLSIIALVSGGLDRLSAITGGIMGYMILFRVGWEGLLLLILFFGLSTFATRYKYAYKSRNKFSEYAVKLS